MSSATDPLDHVFWLASRSAGVVTWLALSVSMVIGLAMATKVAPRTLTPRVRVAHERVALTALVALAAHGLLLLGDSFLRPTLLDLLVPFSVDHAAFWTGLGQIAGYIVVALSLSYYARKRIGARRWRNAHRYIPIAWVLGAVHVVGAGTDIGDLWLQVPFVASIAAVVVLLAMRVLGMGPRSTPPARVRGRTRGPQAVTDHGEVAYHS
jgi:methionine sulfoxide reductase heme-binding subunit